jgi:SAM-dependent methyltransferase
VDLVERKNSPERHPWEIARAEFFLRLLAHHRLLETGHYWLDTGAGDAWFAAQLQRLLPAAATLTCWDVNYSSEDIATIAEQLEGARVVVDRPTMRFDRILMLDVIEHVEDDREFVASIAEDLLTDGGIALVSVPAHQILFSSHDRLLRHHRRYSPAGCRRLLERSELKVIADGGLFHSLLPVRGAQVLLERLRPVNGTPSGIGAWKSRPITTRAVTRALIADGRLSLLLSRRGISLPGLSYWALCRPQRA